MKARIQKWGNSMAVRIPKAVCQQLKLEENAMVELAIEGESLMLTPSQEHFTLEEMVAMITSKNQHGLVLPEDAPRGGEAW